MRKYEHIWELLKKAEPDQWVEVRVRSDHQIQTIINMVQLEKSRATKYRKSLNLPLFGKLEIRRELDKLRVSFRLTNAGHML